MKRAMAITSVVVMLFTMGAWTSDAWARAGGGKSMGNRGSRSASPPAERAAHPTSSAPQAGPQAAAQPPFQQRSGWMSGLMGGLTGLLIGGAIGGLLFGGLGGGSLFGSIGFLEILLIGGLLYVGFVYLRRRQQTTASPYGYGTPQEVERPSWPSSSQDTASATMGMAEGESHLARGLRHIRQMDWAFDPERFAETASDVFFKVQAAWTARDLSSTRDLLSPEMYETLRKECEALRMAQRINRLDNIALRSAQVTEAWQETGTDFVTVHLLASMLDYTVDEHSGQVYEGSRTTPVRFEEYWTFVRPCGPNAWQLSAIQQAE